MELMSAKTYRSHSFVNMDNDKVRVVLDMNINDWRIFRKKYDMPFEQTLTEYCENKNRG